MASRIRIFVVDDDEYTRVGIKSLILNDPRTTLWRIPQGESEASDIFQALSILDTLTPTDYPDVILLDIMYRSEFDITKHPHGIGAVSQINELRVQKGLKFEIKILCLSDSIDVDLIRKALHAGANGYVDKRHIRQALVSAIERVHQGRFIISPRIAEILIGLMDEIELLQGGKAEILSDPEMNTLPGQQRHVASLIFQFGLSAQEVAEHLGIAVTTVYKHVALLRENLGKFEKEDIIRKLTALTDRNSGYE